MACRVDGSLVAVASMAFGWGRGSARRTSHRFGRPRRRDGARRIFTSSWASRASEPRRQRPQYLKDSHRSAHRASPVATGFLRSCVLLCLEVGCLATRPARGLRDRTPAPPPALVRRRPEFSYSRGTHRRSRRQGRNKNNTTLLKHLPQRLARVVLPLYWPPPPQRRRQGPRRQSIKRRKLPRLIRRPRVEEFFLF